MAERSPVIAVTWIEDATNTVYGRITARDGSGAATGVQGEGKWIKQADLSSITCKVFDRNGSTPDTAITTPSITISDVIDDTPDTSQEIAPRDATGVNFVCELGPTNFPTGGHIYRVEFKFTTTGGDVHWAIYEGMCQSVVTS